MCECFPPGGYPLSLWDDNQGGTFTKTPDKELYVPGELIVVQYETGSHATFDHWSPHYATTLPEAGAQTATTVKIGPGALHAYTRPRVFSITVHLSSIHGTVDIPGGATVTGDPPYEFRLPIEDGDSATFVARPDAGYETEWVSADQWTPATWPGVGFAYTDTITVKPRGGSHHIRVNFKPLGNLPSSRHTATVITTGGSGEVYTAGATPHWQSHPGWFFTNRSQTTPYQFLAYCIPDPGYHFVYWNWESGEETYVHARYFLNGLDLSRDTEIYANLTPGIRLAILTEGQGQVSSGDWQSSWNPWPMAGSGTAEDLSYLIDENCVQVTAKACPGWRFDHWEIQDENGGWQTVMSSWNANVPEHGPFEIYMNHYESSPGARRVPSNVSVYMLKAVFRDERARVILLSGENFGSSGGPATSGLNGLVALLNECPECYASVELRDEDDVNHDGSGALYEDIVASVQNGGPRSIALIGHSHGGGSVADLCQRLNSADPNLDHNAPNMRRIDVLFTGYIDAISNEGDLTRDAEGRRPAGSLYHSNLFQTNTPWTGGWINGAASVGAEPIHPNADINGWTCVDGVNHTNIDECEVVLAVMQNRLGWQAFGLGLPEPVQDYCADFDCFFN